MTYPYRNNYNMRESFPVELYDDNMGWGFFKKIFRAVTKPISKAVKISTMVAKTISKPVAKVFDETAGKVIGIEIEDKLNKLLDLPNLAASGKITLSDINDATVKSVTGLIKEHMEQVIQAATHPSEVLKESVEAVTNTVNYIPIIGEPIADVLEETTDMVIDGMSGAIDNIGSASFAMVRGDFSSDNLNRFGKGMLQGISSGMAVVTVSGSAMTDEMLRHSVFQKLDSYAGGLISSAGRLQHVPQQVIKEEKVNLMMVIIDSVSIGLAVLSGGTAVALMVATNAIVDSTGLDAAQGGIIARVAILAATRGGSATSNIKIAVMDASKKMAIEKASKKVIEQTPINDSAIVKSVANVAVAKSTGKSVPEVVVKEAINHTAKNVPVKKELITSIVNIGTAGEGNRSIQMKEELKKMAEKEAIKIAQKEIKEKTGIDVPITEIKNKGVKTVIEESVEKESKKVINKEIQKKTGLNVTTDMIQNKNSATLIQNVVKKKAEEKAKEEANKELEKKFGPEVTVDRIEKYGSKLHLDVAGKALKGLNSGSKTINYEDAKSKLDISLVTPNGEVIETISKEIQRTPENMSKIVTKAAKESARTAETVKAISVKVGKEVSRAPENLSQGAKKVYDNISKDAQKEWDRFINSGYKKHGAKLFEFLMSKYGQQDSYDGYIQESDYIDYLDWEMTSDAYARSQTYPKHSYLLIGGGLLAVAVIGVKMSEV